MSSRQESPQPFQWHYAQFDDSNFQIRGRTLFFIIVLFSIILLVALLFLYARWVCRFDSPPTPTTTTLGPQLNHAPSPQSTPGLDLGTINSFPIVLHNNSASDVEAGKFCEAECCICLGLFGDGDKVKVLPPCHHFFHSECVDMWLTTQSSCPLCRASLRVDSAV